MARSLRVAGATDVGREREHNEDSYGLMPDYNLFVVADGMGGHRAGDVASGMAIKAIGEFFKASEKEDITWPFHFDPEQSFAVNRLTTAIQMANSDIYKESIRSSEHQGMGTTAVAIFFMDDIQSCLIAHVGDSRCYCVRNGSIQLLTTDHSLVNDYLRAAPDLTEEQLGELPRNVITRALGMQDQVAVDWQPYEPQPGDLYLLCSDGLNGMLTDEQILKSVADHPDDLEAGSKELIKQANEHGGEDNITVVLVKVVADADS